LARPDFRSQAAARLSSERDGYTPALMDLLKPDDPGAVRDVRRLPLDRVQTNPAQPRRHFDEDALADLAASIREHGVLQPILVRPFGEGYQIVAGERRWRASRLAGLLAIPAIVEQIDDEDALEIAIIENLQREDISPLEEAEMFARMTTEHGYSLRKLATKLGKDKGYLENRLRLVDAPDDVRALVAERSDTLSHAYELMKVTDPRKRRRLARQVAAGELSLVKLRQRIEGRPKAEPGADDPAGEELAVADVAWADEADLAEADAPAPEPETLLEVDPAGDTVGESYVAVPIVVDEVPDHKGAVGLDVASDHLSAAIAELTAALTTDPALAEASGHERQQFAKYLTMAKIKLENAIAVVRQSDRGLSHTLVSQLEEAITAAEQAAQSAVEPRD